MRKRFGDFAVQTLSTALGTLIAALLLYAGGAAIGAIKHVSVHAALSAATLAVSLLGALFMLADVGIRGRRELREAEEFRRQAERDLERDLARRRSVRPDPDTPDI